MLIKGKITKFLEVLTGTSEKGEWKKQSFVIDTEEKYDNIIAFDVFGAEKVENLTKYNKEGDVVTVEFNLKCREYKGKYYTNLGAWKISKEDAPETETDDLPWP